MHRADSVNRLSRWVYLPVLGALSVAATGCIIVDDDDDDYYYEPVPEDPYVAAVSIDEGAELEAEPGAGVGVFVEYQGAGVWRVWTTCDTDVTGAACTFDLYLDGANLDTSVAEDLEGADELEERGDSLLATLSTSSDTDGVIVQIDPDTPLRLEVWLDGALDERFVSWVSAGQVQGPPPSNPVDFVP